MSPPTLVVIRDRLADAMRANRDHDAYWGRASAGWRPLGTLCTIASRHRYVPPERVLRVLRGMVEEGMLEARQPEGGGDPEFRWRAPVVPVGGDERMAQA